MRVLLLSFLFFNIIAILGCQKELRMISTNDTSLFPSQNTITSTTIVAVDPETNETPFSGLITSMKAKASRITLCLIGDSTGNEDNEWFFKVIKWLLTIFPDYVVEYHIWNNTLDNYSSTIRTIKGLNATASSPVLIVYNGSRPGATIGFLTNTDRLKKFVPANCDYKDIILSCSHNDKAETGSTYISKYRYWRRSIKNITTKGQVVVVTQNPEIPPSQYIEQHAIRRTNLLSYGVTDTVPVIDCFKAFNDYTASTGVDLSTLIRTDGLGLHPNDKGSQVWADRVISEMKKYL